MTCIKLMFLVFLSSTLRAAYINPSADTFVEMGNPGTNYGTLTTFRTGNDGGSFDIPKNDDTWTIIRFDLPAVIEPFTIANLNFYALNLTGNFDVYGVADLGVDENFDETTYTFSSSAYSVTASGPGHDGALNKNHPDLSLLGSFSTTATPQTVSYGNLNLLNFLNADSNDVATFVIYQSTQNKSDHNFASREASSGQPFLFVSTQAIPEPSTLGLIVLGMLASSGRMMRRFSRG